MVYCQACLTENPANSEVCTKCGTRLLILGGNNNWDEPEVPRFSMEDHFLERISNLEETLNNVLEHLSRLGESMEVLDRNSFVTRSGLTSLVETLKETNLLREELLYQRWESTMVEQMEEARYRDRFTQMRGRFLALYRGAPKQKNAFLSLIEEAEFLIYSDRFHESAEVLSKAIKLDPQNYELAYYLAEYYQQNGMNPEAIEFLNVALESNPDHADSLLILALLHYGEGDVKPAEKLLSRCIEVNPHNPVALLSMGSLLTDQERYDEARPLLLRVNEMDPQAQCYYLLGVAAKDQGRLKEAIDHLNYATELDPEHENAVFTLGMAYLERGWTRKAKTAFSRALELNPNKIEYQEASHFDQPRESDPESLSDEGALAAFKFAESLFQEGKLKQAVPHYRALLRKHPNDHVILSSFGALNYSLRRYDEALKVVKKILDLENVSEMVRCVAYVLQLESLRAQGQYDEAIASVTAMLEEFSGGYGQVIGKYGLAMTKADLGQDLNQAEKLAKEALEQSPPDFRHNVLDALGWVYFKQGRFEEALRLLESALSMHETLNHLYHYGMILLALNLQEEAFKVFERSVKLRGQSARVDDFIFTAIRREMETTAENR